MKEQFLHGRQSQQELDYACKIERCPAENLRQMPVHRHEERFLKIISL